MNRLQLDVLAGAFVTVVSAVVGLPIVFGADDPAAVPRWVWAAGFVLFVAVQIVCMWFADVIPRPRLLTAFVVMVVLGPLLVLAVPGAGWLPILLVFTAALSVPIVDLRGTSIVIAVNVVGIGLATWWGTGRLLPVALVTLLYTALQVASVASMMSQERQERIRRRLTAAHVELRTASAMSAELTRTGERLRIARELHDLIGHQLTALSLELEVASHRSEPPASEHVLRARSIARELLSDVRTTVGELRRCAPDLRATLDRIVSNVPDLEVKLEIENSLDASEEVSAVLIRCTQEILTNTIRHSGATRLSITIGGGSSSTLTASDNGTSTADFVPGNGLTGMTERVHAAGGRIRYWADGSFNVAIEIPSESDRRPEAVTVT